MQQNCFYNADIELKDLGGGIRRKILVSAPNLMICELQFETGAVAALHSHVHEQCTYIVEGKFEFDVGGTKYVISAGDCLYKQPNLVHGAVCLEKGKLIDAFTPCREDFLI